MERESSRPAVDVRCTLAEGHAERVTALHVVEPRADRDTSFPKARRPPRPFHLPDSADTVAAGRGERASSDRYAATASRPRGCILLATRLPMVRR